MTFDGVKTRVERELPVFFIGSDVYRMGRERRQRNQQESQEPHE